MDSSKPRTRPGRCHRYSRRSAPGPASCPVGDARWSFTARGGIAPDHPVAHAASQRPGLCVVAGCDDTDLDSVLWLTRETDDVKDSRIVGRCCSFHAVVVPQSGLQAFSCTMSLSGNVVTPEA